MRLGTLRTPVTLWRRPKTSGDSDGYEEALTPSAWWAAIVPYQGQTDIRATVSQVIMRYHPQVDVDTIVRVPPSGLGYADHVRADGAIAYWRLNESSGLVAADSVGTAHGTISATGVTLGQPGALADGTTAMRFDGVAGAITVPAGSYSAVGTGPATMECWINTGTDQVSWVLDTKGGAGMTFSGGSIGLNPQIRAELGVAGVGAFHLEASGITAHDATWHHVVVTLSRGAVDTFTLYVDGALQGATNAPVTGLNPTASQPLALGTFTGNAGSTLRYQGLLDDVAFYHVALTPSQIAAHYALRTAPLPSRERQIHVVGVQDVENRHTELLLTCEEVWP